MAAFGCCGAVGKIAGIPVDGGVAARGTAAGGVGAIWSAGGGAGAGEVVGAVLAGWRASGAGNWDDIDGEDFGHGDCGAAVSIDADAIADNWVVPMGL